MGAFTSSEPTCAADHWCGQLTVPRELALAPGGNAVLMAPVGEIEALRADTRDFGAFELGADQDAGLADDVSGAAEVEVELDLARTTAERVDLVVHRTPDGHQTVVSWDDQSGRVWLDRRLSGRGGRGYRSVPVPAEASGLLRLRVIIDRSSVEVVVGRGDAMMSSLVFPPEGPRALVLSAESGAAMVASLRVHRLRSIWESPDR
jgi:beta-fructofuranosidase